MNRLLISLKIEDFHQKFEELCVFLPDEYGSHEFLAPKNRL